MSLMKTIVSQPIRYLLKSVTESEITDSEAHDAEA